MIVEMTGRPVNVASVAQRSPFRYPGGKTWLVPFVRNWIASLADPPKVLIEPFAGGAIVGLSVAAEHLAEEVLLCELDHDVASVWRSVLQDDPDWLVRQILRFNMTRENVVAELSRVPHDVRDRAFQTIIRNRAQRGGILAPGASLVRNGENGRGVRSRWYPQTLARRIRAIAANRDRIRFVEGDGLGVIRRFVRRKTAAFFVDPPYTAGGKRAGRRLYRHNEIDHHELFKTLARSPGAVMLTYDDTEEVRALAASVDFRVESVPMKNTHHAIVRELVIVNKGTCTPHLKSSLTDLSCARDGRRAVRYAAL